jgi:hypothetical protein
MRSRPERTVKSDGGEHDEERKVGRHLEAEINQRLGSDADDGQQPRES